MDFINDYGNGIYLPESTRKKVISEVLKAIKKELPEEAQCANVITSILTDAEKEILNHKLEL